MNPEPSSFVPHLTSTRAAAVLTVLLASLAAPPAWAQLPLPNSTQFDVTGFIESATLDPACSASPHCGGTLVVNGQTIVVPAETIVILPASALTWQELFANAPLPYTGVATGLALEDVPVPLTTYEAHVVGNRVIAGGSDRYIAGLVNVAQQGLNSGAGYINFIDYATGEFRVGGLINDGTTGTRIRLNDPVGRFGRVASPDTRFSVDDANPTIAAATGFPMCIPRVAPSNIIGAPETDPLCPQANRNGASTIQMNDPGTPAFPSARFQAPMQVGDYVTFAGTLVTDDLARPTAGPWPATGFAGVYVSAHTVINNTAIYTWPGTNPAYVSVEVSLIGTGGLTVIGAGEAAVRTRFEGMTTDPSRNVHLYGIDLDPLTGAATDRDWGTIGVDPGPPVGAVKGRWRFRPPCTAAVATDKACTPPPGGVFIPPTREMRAVIEGLQPQGAPPAGAPVNVPPLLAANGIIFGQYHAPIGEYIFPENIPGTPIVPNNFNSIPFLAQGGYTSAAGTLVGQLNPWPDSSTPTPACIPPAASAGGPYTVASAGTVGLSASSSGTAPIAFAWGAPASGTLSSAAIANPTYTATATPGVVTLTVTATNACGSSTATTTVTVNGALAPTIAPIAAFSVFSGAAVVLAVSATDPNVPAQNVTFSVTQAGAPPATGLTITQLPPRAARINFNAPVLPLGQVASTTFTLTVGATNAGGAAAAPAVVTVTVKPLPDLVTITNVTYRTSKQRLVITASDSVVSPNVILTLQAYRTTSGTTFDPSVLGNTFTNTGGGLYTLTLVGAPQPAGAPSVLTVTSNLGGSGTRVIDLVRQ